MQHAEWSGVARADEGGATAEFVSGERTPGSPMTAGSRFQAGSVSKTVMAIAALRVVERGALDLVAPVGEVLPDLPSTVRGLTLHQLLSHTSGLGHWPDLPEVDMTDPPDGDTLLRMVLDLPLPNPTGTWRYSNFGYLLAARVLVAVEGGSYADLVRRLVLEPAAMTGSTSGAFPIGDDDCATGHHDGEPLTTSPTPTTIPGTGDLWTTAADLIRLSRALHAGRLLEPRSLAAMTTPQIRFPAAPVGDERVVAEGYGYGMWLGSVAGAPAAIAPGDNDGYRSLLAHPLGTDRHLAILTNDDGPTLRRPLDLLIRAPGTDAR